jgi:hypothetical protein
VTEQLRLMELCDPPSNVDGLVAPRGVLLFAFALLAARACSLAFMTRRLTPNKYSSTLCVCSSPPVQSKLRQSDDIVNNLQFARHKCLVAVALSVSLPRARHPSRLSFLRLLLTKLRNYLMIFNHAQRPNFRPECGMPPGIYKGP